MAYSVTFQPEGGGLRLFRSPIVAAVFESDAGIRGGESYFYFCKIQVWPGDPDSEPGLPTGLIGELVTPPRPDGRGLFNVSKLLEDLIEQSGANSANYRDNNRVLNCKLHFGYYDDGDETTVTAGSTFYISDGWAPMGGVAINVFTHIAAINAGQRFLTAEARYDLTDDVEMFTHLFTGVTDKRKVRYTDNQGQSFVWICPDDTRVWRLPLGFNDVEDVNSNEAVVFNPLFNPENGYSITAINLDTDVEYQTIEIHVVGRAFCDMEPEVIAYINRFGFWDYMLFRGRISEAMTRETTTFDRRIATVSSAGVVSYPAGRSRTGVMAAQAKKTFRMNTGYMADPLREKITDLFNSKHWYSLNRNRAVILMPDSLSIQDGKGAEIVNYEVEFAADGSIMMDIQ